MATPAQILAPPPLNLVLAGSPGAPVVNHRSQAGALKLAIPSTAGKKSLRCKTEGAPNEQAPPQDNPSEDG